MKKILLTLIVITLCLAARAQDDMPEVWKTKLDHDINYGYVFTEDHKYSLAANDKEATVFENSTGKILWNKKYKDLGIKLRKIDHIIPMWDADQLFLLDLKMGKEQIAVLDFKTGSLIWESDRYALKNGEMITYIPEEKSFLFTFKDVNLCVDAANGAEKWSSAKFRGKVGKYVYEDGKMTSVNFIPSALGALFSGYKNQIAQINMKDGSVIWENTYVGQAQKKIVTQEFMFDLDKKGDMLVLTLNGIQNYDYKTGANLWSAAFDYEIPVRRPFNAESFGVYGAVPDPVYVDDDVYIVDISGRNKQYIKKYDRKSGKLLWQSEEIKGGARVIPNLYVESGKVIVQIGGLVEIQGVFKETVRNSDGSTTITSTAKVYDDNIKPYGVQAFDAGTGRLAWDSERFKKGITNMYVDNDKNLIVCSGKALYSMKVANGDVNYEVDVKNGGVGNAVQILDYKDMIVVIGEKGVSTFKVKDGNFVGNSKYKRASLMEFEDNKVVLQSDKNDIAAFDVSDNCKHWKYNAKNDALSLLVGDGQYVYVFQKKEVIKLKTRN